MEKTPAGNGRRIAALGLACLLGWGLLKPTDARGATRYWDTDGITPGLGGTGTWSTADANWSTDIAGLAATVPWDNAWASDTANVTFAGVLVGAADHNLLDGTMDATANVNLTGYLRLPNGSTMTTDCYYWDTLGTVSQVLVNTGSCT